MGPLLSSGRKRAIVVFCEEVGEDRGEWQIGRDIDPFSHLCPSKSNSDRVCVRPTKRFVPSHQCLFGSDDDDDMSITSFPTCDLMTALERQEHDMRAIHK